jgi:hypothetical protein
MDGAVRRQIWGKKLCFTIILLKLFYVIIFFLISGVAAWRDYLQKSLGGISHNVPAVYDGLAARIRKCVAFPGPTNCAGGFAWEWSEAE